MTFKHLTKEVLVEVLEKRSIDDREVLQIEVKERDSWMTPIYEYLLSGLLQEDPGESMKIIIRAPQYKLIKGRVLLAIDAQRCYGDKSKLCTMQGTIYGQKGSGEPRNSSQKRMTIQPLGTQHFRTPTNGPGRFGAPRTISSKEEKHFKEGIFADLWKGLKIAQSLSPVTEHTEIRNHIEKQLNQSKQGWVNDLA
ncbi:hypothetical protein Tco_0222126 [Tanacetum coccineum]